MTKTLPFSDADIPEPGDTDWGETLNTALAQIDTHLQEAKTERDRLEQRIDELSADTAGFSEETMNKAQEVGLDAREAVVSVIPARGLGTGFHIGNGLFVTNRHVVSEDAVGDTIELELFPELSNPGGSIDATLLGKTTEGDNADLALMESSETAIPALDYLRTTDMEEGDPIILVGHPRGAGTWLISLGRFVSYASDVTFGYTNADSDADMFVSDIPSRSRNSGSPTLTLDGELIGCLFGSTSNPSVMKTAPEKVHTDFLDHPDYDTHVNSAVFEDHFSDWK